MYKHTAFSCIGENEVRIKHSKSNHSLWMKRFIKIIKRFCDIGNELKRHYGSNEGKRRIMKRNSDFRIRHMKCDMLAQMRFGYLNHFRRWIGSANPIAVLMQCFRKGTSSTSQIKSS